MVLENDSALAAHAGKWVDIKEKKKKKKRDAEYSTVKPQHFFILKLLGVFSLLISVIGLIAAEWSQALHGECFFSQEVTKPKAAKASSCSCVSPFLLFFFP